MHVRRAHIVAMCPNVLVTTATTFKCIYSIIQKLENEFFAVQFSPSCPFLVVGSWLAHFSIIKIGNLSHDESASPAYEEYEYKKLPKNPTHISMRRSAATTRYSISFLANFKHAVINRLWQCQVIGSVFSAPKQIVWFIPQNRTGDTERINDRMGGFGDFIDWQTNYVYDVETPAKRLNL